MNSLCSAFAKCLLYFYRYAISALLPSRCRFYPSCSAYALECFESLPFRAALRATFLRLFRCRPGGSYGYDPVNALPSVNHDAKKAVRKSCCL